MGDQALHTFCESEGAGGAGFAGDVTRVHIMCCGCAPRAEGIRLGDPRLADVGVGWRNVGDRFGPLLDPRAREHCHVRRAQAVSKALRRRTLGRHVDAEECFAGHQAPRRRTGCKQTCALGVRRGYAHAQTARVRVQTQGKGDAGRREGVKDGGCARGRWRCARLRAVRAEKSMKGQTYASKLSVTPPTTSGRGDPFAQFATKRRALTVPVHQLRHPEQLLNE